MAAPALLIPELEEAIQRGSSERRSEMMGRITALFLEGAARFNEEHIRLFDEVLGRLLVDAPPRARIALSRALAPIENAPVQVVRLLAQEDDIEIAGPVLSESSRIGDWDLAEMAGDGSQAHLLAMASRSRISEPLSDVLLARGDENVVRRVAENAGAHLSPDGRARLLEKTEGNSVVADAVRLRSDIPPVRLHAPPFGPGQQPDLIGEVAAQDAGAAAHSPIAVLHQEDRLDEASMLGFIRTEQYAEAVTALGLLCGVPTEVVERLMQDRRADPVLILCKAMNWGWSTAKALLVARRSAAPSSRDVDSAYAHFETLSPLTAQRVMRFWQLRAGQQRSINEATADC